MQRAFRVTKRVRGAVLAVLAAGCAVGASVASCVTAAPADPPQVTRQGPTILQDEVQPVASAYLFALPPGGFVVPVRVSDQNQSIMCKVFVDFDPGADDNQFATPAAHTCSPTLPSLDGGATELHFTLTATNLGDPNACHVIQCFVADLFDVNSAHAPGDGLGADSVTWQYTPNGPGGCDVFDGSDGASPPTDAPTDVLVVPDSVR